MYKLNDIPLTDYGILPGRMDGEGIAVKGIFDLPKRIGDTEHDWAERNGSEPYVDGDEIFYGSRTIYFQGVIKGDKTTLNALLAEFNTAVDGYKDVVPFETPYGTFCVIVEKMTPTIFNGAALVTIEFTEPQVGATCGISIAPTLYQSAEYSENAIKNNCANGYHGSTETLTSPTGKFTSTESQNAADLLAKQWVRDYKQDYANGIGTCIIDPPVWYNEKLTDKLTKNDCSPGLVGSEVIYEVPAFKYSSLESQEDANEQAQAELDTNLTQAYANANGTCLVEYLNELIEIPLASTTCPAGFEGKLQYYKIWPGEYASTVSQADANAIALANSQYNQAYADVFGLCEWIIRSKVTLISDKKVFPIRREKKYRIENPVRVGSVFTFICYGVSVSYTAVSGDDGQDVAHNLKNNIRDVALSVWKSKNAYPNIDYSKLKPEAYSENNVIWVIAYEKQSLEIYV